MHSGKQRRQTEDGSGVIRTGWEIRPRDRALTIRGDFRFLPEVKSESAVVLCHGFKGFRRWGFLPSLARALARRGHAAVTFDFTHNGLGEDGVDFSALDLFSRNTHSRNLEEIGRVLDALWSGALLKPAPRRIALFGHSRGGAEALLTAAADSRNVALTTWSAFASAHDRWDESHVETWEGGGTVHIPNLRTGQEMPIGPTFWQDLVENQARLDVLAHAARLRVPWLIVHGEADETVDVSNARSLFDAAGPNAEMCLIEGGSHTFGATHPYGGPTPDLRAAAQTTLSWLDEQLL